MSDSPFFFVKPTDPQGRRDAYSGYNRSRVFERTSWEWLLERTLRRGLVLSAIDCDDPSVYLASRKSVYTLQTRMVPRTEASYGSTSQPDTLTLALPNIGPRGTFIDVSSTYLPTGSVQADGTVLTGGRRIAFVPSEVGTLVATLACNYEDYNLDFVGWNVPFLDPEDPYHVYSSVATLTETTEAHDGPRLPVEPADWQVETSVGNAPFPATGLPALRLVSDRRCSDDPETVDLPAWDAAAGDYVPRSVQVWKVPDPRDWSEEGDRPALHRWEGTEGAVPVLYGVNPTYAEPFALPCRTRLELETYAGPGHAYRRVVETGADPSDDDGALLLGCSPPPEDPCARDSSGGFLGSLWLPSPYGGDMVSGSAPLFPAPSWGGQPTFWARHGFPRLDPLPRDSVFRAQLDAVCRAQPCIPPATLGVAPAIPPPDGRPAPEWLSGYRYGFPAPSRHRRPFPVACAAEPAEASRMLDLLTCTLVPVDTVYVELSAKRTHAESFRRWGRNLDTHEALPGGWRSAGSEETVVSGHYAGSLYGLLATALLVPTYGNSLPCGGAVGSASGGTYSRYASSTSLGTEEQTSWTASDDVEARVDSLLPVRASVYARPAVRRSYESWTNSARDRRGTTTYGYEREDEEAGDPPGPGDLLLHPDVLAWAESAELLAFLDVSVRYSRGYSSRYHLLTNVEADSEKIPVSESSEAGTRTHVRRRALVRLGRLDLSTGALEGDGLDLKGLLDSMLPGGGVQYPGETESSAASSTFAGSKYYSHTDSASYPPYPKIGIEAARLYAVVRWKFDTPEPPEPSASAFGPVMRLLAAQGRLAALERRDWAAASSRYVLGDAVEALRIRTDVLADMLSDPTAASAVLRDLQATLAALQADLAALDIPAFPEDGVVSAEYLEAKAAAVSLESAIRDVSDRISALMSAASVAMAVAEGKVEAAQAAVGALDASLAEIDGLLEAARDARDAARTAVAGARSAFANGAPDAEAQVEAAEDALDELEDALEEADEALSELRAGVFDAGGAADDAEAAVDAALSSVSP